MMFANLWLGGYLMVVCALCLMTVMIFAEGAEGLDIIPEYFFRTIFWLDPFEEMDAEGGWSGNPMPMMFRALFIVSLAISGVEALLRMVGITFKPMNLKRKSLLSLGGAVLCSVVLVTAFLAAEPGHFDGDASGWIMMFTFMPIGLMLFIGIPGLWGYHFFSGTRQKLSPEDLQQS